MKPLARSAIIALLLFLTGVVGMLALTGQLDSDDPPKTVTTKVDTLDASPDKDKAIVVPKEAVDDAAAALSGEIDPPGVDTAADADHTQLVDETPSDVVGPALARNEAAKARNRKTTKALPTAGASGGVPGCVTSFVRNQSSRNGVRPTVQVLHYTVSPRRPGRSDVNAIVSYFNRSSSGASSNFVIDDEGHCAYIVPIERKAWTQAGGNPWAVSYEIIATGREGSYLGTAGYRKLASVLKTVKARTGIPLQVGRISGCSPSRSGLVQHRDGGSCWGGHHDIGPFPFASVAGKVLSGGPSCNRTCQRRKRDRVTHAQLKRLRCAPPGVTRRSQCVTLHRRHRALHRVLGKPAPER